MPLWIGGLIVVDVQDPTNPFEIQRISAPVGSAIFKVEISSSQQNRVYVTEGIYGLSVYFRLPNGALVLEDRYPIGEGDARCNFVEGVADVCWTWAVDEVDELVGVTYGVLGTPPHEGGYQLISQTQFSIEALDIPEPHLLLLQGSGLLGLAALSRLRRRRGRSKRS
jgi:hypothetical protein